MKAVGALFGRLFVGDRWLAVAAAVWVAVCGVAHFLGLPSSLTGPGLMSGLVLALGWSVLRACR